jgi:hypothetical protein
MMQAAQASMMPFTAPAVGSPASAPVALAISPPAHLWSTGIWMKARDTSAMASMTLGWGAEPPSRVRQVAAFTTRLSPYFLKGSIMVYCSGEEYMTVNAAVAVVCGASS